VRRHLGLAASALPLALKVLLPLAALALGFGLWNSFAVGLHHDPVLAFRICLSITPPLQVELQGANGLTISAPPFGESTKTCFYIGRPSTLTVWNLTDEEEHISLRALSANLANIAVQWDGTSTDRNGTVLPPRGKAVLTLTPVGRIPSGFATANFVLGSE